MKEKKDTKVTETPKLKLKKKNIVYISFAFFTILMLWQIYNFYSPLMLNKLLGNVDNAKNLDWLVGLIMAADNVFALAILPLFGKLSDKTNSRFGKRMPYILIGAIITILAFPFIPIMFLQGSLAGVIIFMAIVLLSMQAYRNPAVSLMPDITPKPLRSEANVIINFIGYIGAIIAGGITMVVSGDAIDASSTSLLIPFILTIVLMIVAICILYFKVKENKIKKEMKGEMELGEKLSEAEEETIKNKTLTKRDKLNVWLIIGSVFLWYFAFNAIETFWSTYGKETLGGGSLVGLGLVVLPIASLIAFIPSVWLAKKVGRKMSVIIGLILIIVACTVMAFMREMNFVMIAMFAVAGMGWAVVNVHSYPMIVEYANSENIGWYTGKYYFASMLAQSITPVAIGGIMGLLGREALFPYSAVFMCIALLVFVFVKTRKVETTSNINENASSDEKETLEMKTETLAEKKEVKKAPPKTLKTNVKNATPKKEVVKTTRTVKTQNKTTVKEV